MLTSLCSRRTYEPFESEILAVLLPVATPRVRSLLYPTKRKCHLPQEPSHQLIPPMDPRPSHGHKVPREVDAGDGPLGPHVTGPNYANKTNPLEYQAAVTPDRQLHGTERPPGEPLKPAGSRVRGATVLTKGPQASKPSRNKAARAIRLPWYMLTDRN